MKIDYLEKVPDPDAYLKLFNITGWNDMYCMQGADLVEALSRSWYVVSAYENERLVALGRILSDGILYAVIFDMIVLPEYQGQGIGTQILKLLLDRCERAGIRDILLFSATNKAGFYEKFGFVARAGEAPGMILRRTRTVD
ncbi:MAG: GNAT family N-acetyltransferase [Planctomycetota bacterium]|jgi:GNAT superfamily N-acetyltransferase